MEFDFGEYQLKWKNDIYPTPGSLAVCQALCLAYFGEAGVTGFEDKKNLSRMDYARSQIAIKKVLDDKNFLEIVDEVFDIGTCTVIGAEEFQSRNKVKLSDVINAPVIDGNGIDSRKLIAIRAKIVNFLSVG